MVQISRKNGYPSHLINTCIKTFIDNCFTKKGPVNLAEKKEYFIILPYLGVNSLKRRTKLVDMFNGSIPYGKLIVIFRSPCRMNSFFKYKNLLCNLVYKFKCIACNSTYIGKTPRHYIVRASEHLSISCFTGDPVDRKSQNKSSVEKHIAEKEHLNNMYIFSIIAFAPYSKYDVKFYVHKRVYLLRDMILTCMDEKHPSNCCYS